MSYPKFLEKLLETGTVAIETPERPSDGDVERGVTILQEFEANWRLEWAATPPGFSPTFASWAGESIYRACQLLVYRNLPVEPPWASHSPEAAEDDKPRQHYNVDLTFRFLPQLWRFTHRETESDPLTEIIRDWCFCWPLSSVGANDLADSGSVLSDDTAEFGEPNQLADKARFPIQEFWSHPSLTQGYVDRIIEHKDRTRVGPETPEVAERILAVAGDHLALFQSIHLNLLITEPIKNEA